jgi:peptide subunit release factor 1 (eRF1)
MLAPILEWRQLQPPHLLVLVDRTGADLVAYAGEESLQRREAGNVDDDPIRKVKPGGWSQRRFQERAEHTWEHNAEAVVDEVSRMAKQFDARLIVAAGDVRALELLEHDLPKDLIDRFTVVSGGRAAGTDKEATLEEALRQVAMAVDQETGRILDRFREEVGQRDLAVEGKDNTLEVLSKAQVDTLLVHDDPEDDRPAYFTTEPIPVAATDGRLQELGVEPRTRGRLIDVLIRAALGTGATVRVIPGESGVSDNVGALLRWTT